MKLVDPAYDTAYINRNEVRAKLLLLQQNLSEAGEDLIFSEICTYASVQWLIMNIFHTQKKEGSNTCTGQNTNNNNISYITMSSAW